MKLINDCSLDVFNFFRVGSLVSFAVAFLAGSIWTQSVSFNTTTQDQVLVNVAAVEDHQVSPGVVFAAFIFGIGTSKFRENLLMDGTGL